MKNRDKWITIVFLIFILAIPILTVARNMLPSQQGEALTEEEKAILEKNGTLINDGESQTESTTSTEETASNNQPKETRFERFQRRINHFTDGLF